MPLKIIKTISTNNFEYFIESLAFQSKYLTLSKYLILRHLELFVELWDNS